nr:MAG TPA: NTP-PPase-like protein [Caudoviricetes sp.]
MNKLRYLREQKNLSLVEVAEKIGVSKLTVLKWEHGTSKISIGKAKKLAEYFGVSVGYLLGLDTPAKDGITELIDKVNDWADERNLKQADPKIQWMRVTEEVGEIRDVFLKPHDFVDPEWSLKDAIGDSIVTLIVLCLQLGYDVEECLTIAYNDIKDRKGKMVNGTFVKEEDL